jgi:hypothetical protein
MATVRTKRPRQTPPTPSSRPSTHNRREIRLRPGFKLDRWAVGNVMDIAAKAGPLWFAEESARLVARHPIVKGGRKSASKRSKAEIAGTDAMLTEAGVDASLFRQAFRGLAKRSPRAFLLGFVRLAVEVTEPHLKT